MDSSEYKLLTQSYSDEDLNKIANFNNEHTKLAKNLLKYNHDKLLNDTEYANLDMKGRIKYIQTLEDYKLFCRVYPIVSKYIIAFGLFSTKAFNRYLNWKSNIRPSDSVRTELINNPRKQELWKNNYVYAVYVKYLYQEKNKHVNLNDINRMYHDSAKSLNIETNEFFDLYEAEMKRIEETKNELTIERKNIIKHQLKLKLSREETKL